MIGLSHGWFKPITKKLVAVASPLRSTTEERLAWNWVNVSRWHDMSTRLCCFNRKIQLSLLRPSTLSHWKKNYSFGFKHQSLTHSIIRYIYIFDIIESGLRNHMYSSNQNKSESYVNVLWKENLYIIYQ